MRDVDEGGEGEFTVCWDPLDGSSIVDNNWAVGTMIGIWPKSTGLIGATGRDQVTSLVALYGPRTTVLVALDDGTYEFTYGCTPEGCQLPDGTWEPWICSRQDIKISPDAKIFAPANLRAAQDLPGYKKLIDHFMSNRYTLRYSGGLVPDVYQQFTKEQGVFSNPTSDGSPAKLRLAFEAAPFGLLVEKSGGKTSDGTSGGSILDVQINAVDQRTPLCIGSANEVDRFNGTYHTRCGNTYQQYCFLTFVLSRFRHGLHGRINIQYSICMLDSAEEIDHIAKHYAREPRV